ncbi:MAG: MMPL family transporter [Nitriliruptoraceae bacterium]|nr:MMPL family transporter [Nitriliruptoraceae bacterium]
MSRLLDALARLVTGRPAITLVVLGLLTVGFAGAATQLEVDTGFDGFAPDDGVAATLDEFEDRFGTGVSIQVLVDDGPGGDVITRRALADVLVLEEALRTHPAISPVLVDDRLDAPAVVSFAVAFETAVGIAGADGFDDLDEPTFRSIATGVLENGGDEVAGLFSDDLGADPPRARAGLVVVELDATASSAERADAARVIEEVAASVPVADARRGALSITAIEDGIEDALNRDLPVLLGVSLLLVLGVLAWIYRRVSDVAVGFLGLVVSIIWMIGLAAILGPGILDVLGPFNQVSVAVPVLLVGLGIDYSVHLTTRYREQRHRGDDPRQASRVALATVGVALVLATIASVAGFLANAVTPLSVIRDFGIFAAMGIVAAFVVLGTAVPAVRMLVDARGGQRAATLAPLVGGSGPAGPTADAVTAASDAARPRWSAALATIATRRPGLAVGLAAVVVAMGAVAATGISTEFDERDFLPEGEPVLATLDRLDALFASGVAERTFIGIDGDPSDPALLAAVAGLEDDLADLGDVDRVDGEPDLNSVRSLRDGVVTGGRNVRDALAEDLRTYDDPVGAAQDVDLPDPDDLVASLGDELDDALDLPVELSVELRRRLPAGRAPQTALAATTDPDELLTEIRAALAEGFAEDRPDELDDAGLATLVALDAEELTLAQLRTAGFPLDGLDDEDLERLERLEALEEAGDPDARDGQTLVAHLEVLRREVPEDLAALVDDDGLLLAVATSAGQERADALAAEIDALAGPVRDAGGSVRLASEPLVNAEIIQELADAQLLAIAISLAGAALLLVVATWFSARAVGLGLIGIVPSVVALVLVLGLMRVIGLPFNALTATVASIAVGIGVPYGIHLTNRYREALARGFTADDAADDALTNTGPALVGSAVTTGLAFAVLTTSSSLPIQQFGLVSTMMIVTAVLGCLLVQPALLVLWGRRRQVRRSLGPPPARPSAAPAAPPTSRR